ncbi:MAG: hypothetical protein AVDCRST_MAG49-4088 [uncultured Thermomicrobiales bacterium]|uniref:N-acetyltransferase domain-containing protein n=1 Tax=uncultured Thermomicrobiales bacterium TaxID=1645740 RepID=A0A6J4VCK2_9BACT|nr:MAG: hypothetical protein AVDCRST_MAG49-4088 [uncultured Thermomicrobiales bacterium]
MSTSAAATPATQVTPFPAIRTGRPVDPATVIADLGDGLVLRHATPNDADALAAFNGEVHRDEGSTGPDEWVAAWTRELLTLPHPTVRPDLFTVVEDTRDGTIASTMNLIPQTWSFDGIPFGVGRPEIVGTHPAYRRRGLVRHQFAEVHRWSAAMGHLAQGITGIPWYYRQFGYEMCLDLGGSRRLPTREVPALPEGEAEPFRLRPATEADLPAIMAVAAHARRRWAIADVRDEALWRLELRRAGESTPNGQSLLVVEAVSAGADPVAVGYLSHPNRLWGTGLAVQALELGPGVSWPAAMPSVLRHLKATGERFAAEGGPAATPAAAFDGITLGLGGEHPAYAALPRYATAARPPYAWFIRVPDLPAFLRHVAPALEERLAASPAEGHTGDLTLGLYSRPGVRLTLDRGKLTAVEPWAGEFFRADASFPDLTFLQLLVGWRSLEEVERAFPDCSARGATARALLDALFPRRPSLVWPVQ